MNKNNKNKKNKKNKNNKNNKDTRRTLSSTFKTNKDTKHILDFISHESKNVYNSFIYTSTVYYKFKKLIFNKSINDIKLSKNKTEEFIDNTVYKYINLYYSLFLKEKKHFKLNNTIIYNFIKSNIKENIINSNIDIIKKNFLKEVYKLKDLYLDNDLNTYLVDDIFYNIINSFYTHNFNYIKNCLLNHEPIKNFDDNFINEVKNNNYILKKITKNLNLDGFKFKSDQNYISRYTYKIISNKIHLPSDIIINIFCKAFEGYKSFFSLKQKGIKCNSPKYLDKDGKYLLPFTNRSFKEVELYGLKYFRLTVGKFVSNNYSKITKRDDLTCLNNTQNKKYIKTNKMKAKKKGITKKNNYIVNNKYVSKNDKRIIDSNYIYVKKHKSLDNKEIKYIEINPKYNGLQYNISIKYKWTNKVLYKETNNIKDYISGDIGVRNLISFYNPTGEQKIISGKYILGINNNYNYKIDKLKSVLSKNNKKTSNRIKKLYIERINRIKNYFYKISNWIYKEYKNKKKIVLGYNKFWKQGIKLGRKTNRTFQSIPYCMLIRILKEKLEKNNIELILREESYTSKCDSLGLEEVKKHETYKGKRIKRGLYSSSTKKLLNADINGAINILRKHLKSKNIKLKKIIGVKLYNPKIIKFEK